MMRKFAIWLAFGSLTLLLAACGTRAEPQYNVQRTADAIVAQAEQEATAIVSEARAQTSTQAETEPTEAPTEAETAEEAEVDPTEAEPTQVAQAASPTPTDEPTVAPTDIPASATPVPASATPIPPTATPVPASATPVPATATDVPPEPTEVEPTAEPTEAAAADDMQSDMDAATDAETSSGPQGIVELNPEWETIPADDDPLGIIVGLANANNGETLFNQSYETSSGQWMCNNCHNIDNPNVKIGPSLWGIADRANTRVEGQGPYTYLYNSILNSDAYIVPGYENNAIMPHYGGADGSERILSDAQIYDLVAYIFTLEMPEE